MQHLTTSHDVDALADVPTAVLLKHSTRCPISAAALEQLRLFSGRTPDVPVFLVDVNDARALSDYVAERFKTRHDSPQAFVLVGGAPVWKASHYAITARDIEAQLPARDAQGR